MQSILKNEPRILGLRVYTLDDQGRPRIAASKDEKEIGQPGTDAEKAAITDGKVYFGRGKGTVAVTLPFARPQRRPDGGGAGAIKIISRRNPGQRHHPRHDDSQTNAGAGHVEGRIDTLTGAASQAGFF